MRFDYLRDAPPEFVERVRALCCDVRIRTLLSFLGTGAVVVSLGWGLEVMHLHDAVQQLQDARERLDRSAPAIARVKSEAIALRRWTNFDLRLREIRVSGIGTAMAVADLARRLPPQAWLMTLNATSSGDDIDGKAIGLEEISRLLSASPSMILVGIHAAAGRTRRILEFRTHVAAR